MATLRLPGCSRTPGAKQANLSNPFGGALSMRRNQVAIAFIATLICSTFAHADSVATVRQWATEAFASSQYSPNSWSARQATGAPNTDRDGDIPTAWAPRVQDGASEWLELVYTMPLVPAQVRVRETCGPGFITKVEAYDYRDQGIIGGPLPENCGGKWKVLWEGEDTNQESPGTFAPPLETVKFATNRIRITIDTLTRGWNEVDAVELVGAHPSGGAALTNLRQWAFRATASSQYGTDDWSAQQATGAPNTMQNGDCSTAWAPANRNGTIEWLELNYVRPVVPARIEIRETYNPGFVTQVEAFDQGAGGWVILWRGEDPTSESPGVFSPPLEHNDFRTSRIRIVINTNVPDWNEIDAVELIGRTD